MMLGTKKLIRSLRLRNFLSFGPNSEEIPLEPLNVLIGPNAAGKSNLIDAIDFLRSSYRDFLGPIRQGGGVEEWLWKGASRTSVAEIEATVFYPTGIMPLRHKIAFTMTGQRFELVDEAVENEHQESADLTDVRFYYRYQKGYPVISAYPEPLDNGAGNRTERKLRREDIALDQSILSQRKEPDMYPEITYLASQYAKIMIYRDWTIGRFTSARMPQQADLPEDLLLENAGNLGLVINHLEHQSGLRKLFLEKLKEFYEPFEDISVKIHAGAVQVFIHEKGLTTPVPATRLSDGTLRYLSLLTILCHPDPPPLVCIEEPELGLHPDILPSLAELMIEASNRMQLIITTQSDILVDSLTDTPEAVLVCDKENGATSMKRLDRKELEDWLRKYALGEIWRMGEIGGKRW